MPDLKVTTEVATRNQIVNMLLKDSKCAEVVVPIIKLATVPEAMMRRKATERGMALCLDAWVRKWGPVPWDRVVWNITHVSVQVLVELRVVPEEEL